MQHPQWIEDIPWWVKYLFLFGGGLMGAFSSNFPPLLQVAGLWTGIISATSGAIAVAWHWTNVWRAKHGKSKLKMDPSYVIILGLLIAAGGVIWQQLRTPQTGDLTVTPVPAASSRGSFSVNPRYLSSAQKDALSDALGKISSVINTQGKEAVYVTANIKVFGSPDRKNLQLAIQQFGKSHDLAEAVYAAIYGDDGVLKKNPDFPELIAIVEYTGVVERFEYMARTYLKIA
jgi:hypothetical protein